MEEFSDLTLSGAEVAKGRRERAGAPPPDTRVTDMLFIVNTIKTKYVHIVIYFS